MAALSVRDRRQKKERKKVRSFFFSLFFLASSWARATRKGKERIVGREEREKNSSATSSPDALLLAAAPIPRLFPPPHFQRLFLDPFLSSDHERRSRKREGLGQKAAIQSPVAFPPLLTPPHKKNSNGKNIPLSYRLIHAEPVLDAAIEPERMEMLKEVTLKNWFWIFSWTMGERKEGVGGNGSGREKRGGEKAHSTQLNNKNKHVFLPQRLLSLSEIISLDDFLVGWFRGAARKSILRGNVEDFIAYGFYAQRLSELGPDDQAEVSDFVERIQERYATSFEPGRNPDLQFMAHLWEPLRVVHSPLALRLALEGMRLFTVLVLKVAGFRMGRVEIEKGARGGRGSSYDFWVLPPAVVEEERKKKKREGAATEEEEEEEEEESAAAAPGAPLLPLRTSDDDNGTPALSRFGRRLPRRSQRSSSSRSLTPTDLASSLEGELSLSVDLEAEAPPSPPSPSTSPPLSLSPADGGDGDGGDDREEKEEEEEEEEEEEVDPSSTAPILFLHGVGLGIAPYLLFVASLRSRFPRRPLLLLEARHVSVGLVPTRAASTCDVAAAALEAMRLHGWRSAAIVAHSYGTFVAARVLAAAPLAVQSLVLLDPVCALTIYPQLLANFVYKPPLALLSKGEKRKDAESRSRGGCFWPKQAEEEVGEKEEASSPTASSSSSALPPPPPPSPFAAAASAASSAAATARALLTSFDSARFLFSRDLTVGEAFCRRFAWHRECLWPQDLRHGGRSTLLGLAAGDDLVPSGLVRSALAAAGSAASVCGNEAPGAGHGGFLLDKEWQGRLLDGAEAVIEAGAREERAERREMRRRRRRRRSERVVEGEGTASAAPAAPLLVFGKEKATAAAFAASAELVDAPNTPARPATADLGEWRRPNKRSFSRPRVVPVVLET